MGTCSAAELHWKVVHVYQANPLSSLSNAVTLLWTVAQWLN